MLHIYGCVKNRQMQMQICIYAKNTKANAEKVNPHTKGRLRAYVVMMMIMMMRRKQCVNDDDVE